MIEEVTTIQIPNATLLLCENVDIIMGCFYVHGRETWDVGLFVTIVSRQTDRCTSLSMCYNFVYACIYINALRTLL